MKKDKREKLERAGWVVGGTQEFLDLSDAEMALIDVRVSLAQALRRRRQELKISQATLAKRIGSSQSRVAKMEAAVQKKIQELKAAADVEILIPLASRD